LSRIARYELGLSGLPYVPRISTELSSGGTQDTCSAFAVQLMTRTLEGVAGVEAVCSTMLSDLADMMNVLLQCSSSITRNYRSLWCQCSRTAAKGSLVPATLAGGNERPKIV